MVFRDHPGTDIRLRPLARLPWWLWLPGGLLAYLWLDRLAVPGPAASARGDLGHLLRALAGLGQWLILGALLLASAGALWRGWRTRCLRREPTADPVGLALRDLGRTDFESVVAEAFRLQGFQVDGIVTVAASGSGELRLSRGGQRALVHIRHWRAWRVSAADVQTLIAAMAEAHVERGYLVIPGEFTRDARHLAAGRPIELIDGAGLRNPVQGTQGEPRNPPVPQPRQRRHLPIRYWLRIGGILIAAGAILGGFSWIANLPDKRIAPPEPPAPSTAEPISPGPTILVPEPPAPAPAKPPPGLGGFRSVQDMDAAFEAFYIPPPGCASPTSRDDMVACANHRIRARRGYMAARSPAESKPEPQAGQEEVPGWDQEGALDASGRLQPDQAETEQPPDDTEASGPAPGAPPRSDDWRDQDPAATYAPYDPKVPWAGP